MSKATEADKSGTKATEADRWWVWCCSFARKGVVMFSSKFFEVAAFVLLSILLLLGLCQGGKRSEAQGGVTSLELARAEGRVSVLMGELDSLRRELGMRDSALANRRESLVVVRERWHSVEKVTDTLRLADTVIGMQDSVIELQAEGLRDCKRALCLSDSVVSAQGDALVLLRNGWEGCERELSVLRDERGGWWSRNGWWVGLAAGALSGVVIGGGLSR